MVWTQKWKQYDEMSIRRIISPGRPGVHVGWMLTAYATSDWAVCRVIGEIREVALRIEKVRDCTQQEKDILNVLLWTTQICMRYKPIEKGNPWAFACFE